MQFAQSLGQFLLKPILSTFIGAEKLQWFETIDWQQESDRFRQAHLTYPHYYSSQNFHGITGGYLNAIAAITYDAVTAFASPPNETWIRQQLIQAIVGQPTKILDLGCGTGSTTIMLKQAFPQAEVMGLDLSPYMLVMAEAKARQAELDITWQQGLAEETGLVADTFDLVTAAFLFHEMPPQVSQRVLHECWRLLKPGGQLLILDGDQPKLRRADWLITLFQEPYSKVYAAGSVDNWLNIAQFEAIATKPVGWISQLSSGSKPTAAQQEGTIRLTN